MACHTAAKVWAVAIVLTGMKMQIEDKDGKAC
jgi:hypothetical protein